jgi:hypothetical protein
MVDGTDLLMISATIPHAESFLVSLRKFSIVKWASHSSPVDLFSLGTLRSGSVLDSHARPWKSEKILKKFAEWRCVNWN